MFKLTLLVTAAAILPLHAQTKPAFRLLYSVPGGTAVGEPTVLFETAPGMFYGLGLFGGTYGGTVFSITGDGQLSLVYGIPVNDTPIDSLVQAADGDIWGVYATGQNQGSYFSLERVGGTVSTYPNGPFGAPGNVASPAPPDFLYDLERPIVGQSYIFSRINSVGQITPLHNFQPADGFPYYYTPLIRNIDHNFYGIALQTVSSPPAWIYKITPSGEYSKFAQFPDFPLSLPGLPMVATLNGNLFVAFGGGGANNKGEIYKITPAGKISIAASFPATGMNGPQSLMLAADGNLYGSTTSSPSYIFRLVTATNKLEEVYSFGGSEGQCACVLTEGMDGKLYGTAARGGLIGIGTIFSLDIGLTPPTPVITEVSPHTAAPGARVLLLGVYLLGARSVTFNGVPATDVTSTSGQSVWARVPQGATSGPITVTTANGSFTTRSSFVVQ